MGGKNLFDFSHPKKAIYLLGAEDHGLPNEIIAYCNGVVSLSSIRSNSYNVSISGAIVMYHRMFLCA
jgi:tRNA G18 (ribose-2'-O)-methylase SpoU